MATSQFKGKRLSVTLKPNFEVENIVSVDVRLVITTPQLKTGEVLVSLPLSIANIPSTRYDGANLKAFDAQGNLDLDVTDDPDGAPIVSRKWKAKRETHGDVLVVGVAFPRRVDVNTPTGPAFDMRTDNGGIITSGYAFLPVPPDELGNIDIELDFDLCNAPVRCHAVGTSTQSLNNPTFRVHARPGSLQAFIYMIGPVEAVENILVHGGIERKFGIYWLSPPPFNVQEVSATAQKSFLDLCNLLEEREITYRIFLRHDPYPVLRSGVALPKCFTVSFGSLFQQDENTEELLTALFTHEMVHNWLLLDERETAAQSLQWYGEGLAEYYSLFIRLNRGLSVEKLRYEANYRASAYYTSPLARLSDAEAGKLTWKTANAQRLPYGRGFVFWVRVNALIQMASDGKRSLDNLCTELVVHARQIGRWLNFEEFLAHLEGDIGASARSEIIAIAAGNLVVPPENSLAPGCILRRCDQEMFDLGFDEDSILKGPRIVRHLKPDSRAAQAGVLDGDELLSWTDLNETKNHFQKNQILQVKRGDRIVDIEFWPRSYEVVEAYYWETR